MRDIWNFLIGNTWLAALLSYISITTLILILGPLGMMLFTWIERRGIAYMQNRRGPNRVGPFGLFQPISEAIKTMTKEDITPTGADRWVHFFAPVLMMTSVILIFAVIPLGSLYPSDINVGILWVMAGASLHPVGALMAGWGSNNKFALLGGMRAAAQLISYEIPQVMSVVVIVMWVGSMNVSAVINHQSAYFGMGWHVFTPIGLLAFIIFWIASLAEGERTPFDIPEAESEIVAGVMTEYTGMKFAIFYLANYMGNLAICAVTAGVFLGGGHGPGTTLGIPVISTLLTIIYFLIKVFGLFLFMVFIRATLPRLRVDQMMSFAWKFLLPLALVNIFSTGIWIAITRWGSAQGVGWLEGGDYPIRLAIAIAVTLVINGGMFATVLGLYRGKAEDTNYAVSPASA